MFKADEASELSVQGSRNQQAREEEAAQRKHEAWIEQEKGKNPQRIREAERLVRIAANQGKRSAKVMQLVWGVDYSTEDYRLRLDDLAPPHRELVDTFKEAGYVVSFQSDMEPEGASWHNVVLRW